MIKLLTVIGAIAVQSSATINSASNIMNTDSIIATARACTATFAQLESMTQSNKFKTQIQIRVNYLHIVILCFILKNRIDIQESIEKTSNNTTGCIT